MLWKHFLITLSQEERKKTEKTKQLFECQRSASKIYWKLKKEKKLCVKLCRHRLIYFYLESLLLFVITSSKLECSKIHNCSYSVSFQCDKNKIEMTNKMCIMLYFFRLTSASWARATKSVKKIFVKKDEHLENWKKCLDPTM